MVMVIISACVIAQKHELSFIQIMFLATKNITHKHMSGKIATLHYLFQSTLDMAFYYKNFA